MSKLIILIIALCLSGCATIKCGSGTTNECKGFLCLTPVCLDEQEFEY